MKLFFAVMSMLVMINPCMAMDFQIVGTIPQTIKLSTLKNKQAITAPPTKNIKLLKITLSEKAKKKLVNKVRTISKSNFLSSNYTANIPSKIELGMSNVPVLDQGAHGSCVTFSITAAADAVLKKGDYISQLCQLQLGNYLESHSYGLSGWNGTTAEMALTALDTFGFVNKIQERNGLCGELSEYPLSGETPSSFISLEEFHNVSEPFTSYFNEEGFHVGVIWSPILNTMDKFLDEPDSNKILNKVKKTLSTGDRITFGTLLLNLDAGVAGAAGSNKAEYDTWILTPQLIELLDKDDTLLGAHEMVITGYNDNAVAKDDQGNEHKGLLTLRNSWGEKSGDKGNFYMSYDYFKIFVLDAQRIRDFVE